MTNEIGAQEAAAITDRLRALGFEAEEKTRAVSGIEKEAAVLWAQVIDSKVYKTAGFSSLVEYMEEIQTPYTRGYVYNLADCARCQPVIDRYEELGPKNAIEISKAYKQDKITWEQAAEIVQTATGRKLNCDEVRALVKEAAEENAPDLTPLQELLEEKENLLQEQIKIKARLKEIKARLEDLEDQIQDEMGA